MIVKLKEGTGQKHEDERDGSPNQKTRDKLRVFFFYFPDTERNRAKSGEIQDRGKPSQRADGSSETRGTTDGREKLVTKMRGDLERLIVQRRERRREGERERR